MILLPALSSVHDILDTDLVLVEHSNGEGFKMTGADLKNFINAQATDTVALNNMQSVTSNAVASAINNCVLKNNTILNGTVDDHYGYADFDLATLSNKICNVYVVGNSNRRYLGKFNIAEYQGGYSIVIYYAPSLTISIVDNKVRVSSNDGCYEAKLTYFDSWNVERILQ
jgi:hypothetical protein